MGTIQARKGDTSSSRDAREKGPRQLFIGQKTRKVEGLREKSRPFHAKEASPSISRGRWRLKRGHSPQLPSRRGKKKIPRPACKKRGENLTTYTLYWRGRNITLSPKVSCVKKGQTSKICALATKNSAKRGRKRGQNRLWASRRSLKGTTGIPPIEVFLCSKKKDSPPKKKGDRRKEKKKERTQRPRNFSGVEGVGPEAFSNFS